jgi:hypothetical protein
VLVDLLDLDYYCSGTWEEPYILAILRQNLVNDDENIGFGIMISWLRRFHSFEIMLATCLCASSAEMSWCNNQDMIHQDHFDLHSAFMHG